MPWGPARAVPAVSLAVGDHHACATFADGTVRCWGEPEYLRLGVATGSPDVVAVPGVRDAVQVAAGSAHTCARRRDGTLRCWGRKLEGQLGRRHLADLAAPGEGSAAVPGLRDVVVDESHACGLARDGAVWSVGGARGTLLHTSSSRAGALQIPGLSRATALAGGGAVTCAVAGGDGSVRCWGAPDYDPWAPNAPSGEVLTEVRAVPGLVGAAEVAAGYGLACARHRDGRVACWRGGGGRDAPPRYEEGTTQPEARRARRPREVWRV